MVNVTFEIARTPSRLVVPALNEKVAMFIPRGDCQDRQLLNGKRFQKVAADCGKL
jgi:hypothetical protein